MPGYVYRGAEPYVPEPPARRPVPRCGTPSGYARHKRRKEPVDEACRLANIDACKARRERRKANT